MLQSTRSRVIKQWLEQAIAGIRAQYNSTNKASGAAGQSLRSKVSSKDGITKGEVFGNDYWYYLIHGRGKSTGGAGGGTKSVKEMILEWIINKGITPKDGISNESLAFLIARKIHEKGVVVPNPRNQGDYLKHFRAASDMAQRAGFAVVDEVEIIKETKI